MRKIGFAAILPALAALAGCAHQPPAPPPEPPKTLFAMFQKYCVATEGQYAAVDKAATEDGFVNLQGKLVVAKLFNVESNSWQKKKDTVSVGPLHNIKSTPDGKVETVAWDPPQSKAEFCSVNIQRDRDDSQAIFAKWAGVPVWHSPRAAEAGDEISDSYNFRIENGKHVLEERRLYSKEAITAGTWSATMYKRGSEYSMSIKHYYVPKP